MHLARAVGRRTSRPGRAQRRPVGRSTSSRPRRRHAAAAGGAAPDRRFVGLLAVGFLVQVGIRLWFAAASSQPTSNPDEIGYLAAARLISGGARTALDLSGSTFYQAGYPLLIAPAWALRHDPATVYRLVLVENALISALMLPLAYLLARRCELERLPALLVANVAALLPCAVFYTGFAVTDAVLPVIVLGWLLTVHSWLTAAPGRRCALLGAAAAGLAGWTYAIHSRGELVAAAEAVLVVTAAVLRWRRLRECLLSLGALAVTGLAAHELDLAVQHRLYPSGIRDLGGNIFDRLDSLDGWGWTARLASGQLWYQLVATGGVAGIGLVALAATACRRRVPGPTRAVAATAAGLFLAVAFATSAAMNDSMRVGTHAYNRYLYCASPVLVVVGCAFVLHAPWRRLRAAAGLVAAGTVATAVVVTESPGPWLRHGVFVPMDAFEVSSFTRDWARLDVTTGTVVGLALLAVAVAVSRAPRSGLALFTAALVLPSLLVLRDSRAHVSGPFSRSYAVIADGSATLQAGARTVALDSRLDWRVRMTLLYDDRWARVEDFDPTTGGPPADASLAVLDWDGTSPTDRMWKGQDTASWQVRGRRRASGPGTPAAPHFDGWVAWQRTPRPGGSG